MRRRIPFFLAQVTACWALVVSSAISRGQEGPAAGGNGRAGAAPRAAGAATDTAKQVDPARMDWLLKKWEQQSTKLKTLDVAILRVDDAPAWGDKDFYEGRALFKSPNLAFIDFRRIKLDDKKKPMRDPNDPKKWVSTPYERIICTGEEVWQYSSDTQQIFIFPLEKDEQKKAVEEGPLPFLFNMRADDAKQRYQMTLMSEDEKTFGVSIKPRLKEDKESFSMAFVNLDRTYLLPVRIILLSPDGKSSKDFQLGPMYPNRAVNDRNFQGKPLGPPWKLVRNPAGEERPRAGVTRPRREAAGEPAAARQRAGGVQR
jgi:TIGR03009 family protein